MLFFLKFSIGKQVDNEEHFISNEPRTSTFQNQTVLFSFNGILVFTKHDDSLKLAF